LYWNRRQVRVWLNNGRMLDLGPRSFASARLVARELGYRFIATEQPPALTCETVR